MRHPVLRYGAAALCVLGAVYFLLPLSIGVLHIGMLYPAAGLLLAAAWLVFPRLFRRWPRWLRRTVCVVLVAVLLALGTILTLMGIRAAHHPDGTQPVTVIVLGCQVRSDGTPSRMLQDRIQAAYDYLSIHEEAVCVASGGQNNQEPTTEARCIRDTLVSMGIAPGRIYLEDASISTEENLAFSAEVIRREGSAYGGGYCLRQFSPAAGRCMGGEGRAYPLLSGLRQHLDAWPRLLGQGGRRSAVYGRDRRTVMELCFTGISSKKGIPAAKPPGYPFCVAKSLFATQRHFSELQEALKNGDHHRAGHPSGFPAHTLPPRWRKALTLGGRLRVSRRQKPSGYPFLHRFSGPFRRRGDFYAECDNVS
ncbi:MAG: YdcF family protein [Oscillospiraceae bacterium]